MANFDLDFPNIVICLAYNSRTDPGGTLYIFGWGCAAETLKPLPYTSPRSADFATLY